MVEPLTQEEVAQIQGYASKGWNEYGDEGSFDTLRLIATLQAVEAELAAAVLALNHIADAHPLPHSLEQVARDVLEGPIARQVLEGARQ